MEKVTMEFKNFENKLIIEKITNYCIENNINAQEINALTAKIKFGKLDQNILNEDLKKHGLGALGAAAGVGAAATYAAPLLGAAAAGAAAIPGAIPFAVGAGAAGAAALGRKLYQRGYQGTIDDAKKGLSRFGNKFTTAGRYKNAVEDIKDILQTGIDSINKINSGLDPLNPNNIFKTHKIDLDAKKTRSLVDAVKGLKDSLDSSAPQLKSALNDIGAEVSGLTSNYGDASTGLNFQFAFKDELDKITGITDPGFKPDMKKRIISNLKINASTIYAKLETPEEKENYLINLKTQLAKAIADINSTDNNIKQNGKIKLQALTTGNVSAAAAAPTKPTKPILKQAHVEDIIDGQGGTNRINDIYKHELNLQDNYDLIKDNYEKYYQNNDYQSLIRKIQGAMSTVTGARQDPAPVTADPDITKKLVNAINTALTM